MSIQLNCPNCNVNLLLDPEKVDQLLYCPNCKRGFRLRARHRARPVLHTAPKAAALPVALPPLESAHGHRSSPPTMDDLNETIAGQVLAARRMAVPPPVEDAAPPVPPSERRNVFRWVILGSLLIVLLVVSSLGVYALERLLSSPSPSPIGSNAAAENPVFGKWGAIEIGSKGIKALVIDVFEAEDKDGYDFSIVWQADANPTLVAAVTDSRMLNPKALDAAEDHVKRFFTTMREKHDLSPERIYVLSSSGLFAPFAKDPDALAKNKAAIAERVKAATGGSTTFITAKDEARLGMKSCVPPKYWKESVFIDIGSGNIKGGYFESDEVFEGMDLDLGSVTYVKKVKDEAKRSGKAFAEQVSDSRPTLLEQPLRDQIDRMPGLAKQKKVYLAGGIVWALVTFTHPSDTKERVELAASDIERFARLIRKPESEVRNEVLAQVKDSERWKKSEKEIADVQKRFKPENLQAGAEILKALSNEYRFADKRLYFFRKSHLAWPLGFVLEKKKIK